MTMPDQNHALRPASLEDLLAAHTDALLTGQPLTPRLEALPAAEAAQARELLFLAQRLRETLVPDGAAAPSAEFLSRLKGELLNAPAPSEAVAMAPHSLFTRWQRLPAPYRLAAGLGGLTLTAGLTLLAGRGVVGLFNRLNRPAEPNSDASLLNTAS